MRKYEIKELIKSSIPALKLCKVRYNYENDKYYHFLFPLKTSDKLFLGAVEEDFILDGYTIRRYRDVKKVEDKGGKYLEINRAEGVLEELFIPDVDVTSWKTVFESLQKIGKNIIVEDENNENFAAGKIEKVLSNKIIFKCFDADGIWEDCTWEIPFSGVTTVTFSSRYIDVFSKYVKEEK